MTQNSHVKRIISTGPDAAKLEDWPAMNPGGLVSGTPVQKGCLYDEDEATDYSVGIWECTAFVDQPGPYPVDEFMLLLDGSVQMLMPDGTQVTVNAGEAFVIPKGLDCQWTMSGTVRKIFMILDGQTPADADNAGLNRITVPPLDMIGTPPSGALTTRDTHFVNHDDCVRVHIDSFHSRLRGPAPQAGRHLITVLSGSVSFTGASGPDFGPAFGPDFGPGDSLYLLPGSALTWDVAAGTRLLIAACDLPRAAPAS